MLNKTKLKAVIALNKDSQNELADRLGITVTTLSLKMNGKNQFKPSEIYYIKKCYNLTAKELDEIFFATED